MEGEMSGSEEEIRREIDRLLGDPSFRVRLKVFESPYVEQLQPHHVDRLVDDPEAAVRLALVRSANGDPLEPISMQSYYRNQFKNDVAQFREKGAIYYNELFGRWEIQVGWCEKLSAFHQPEQLHAFLLCLYLTVLIDQAVYTYYRDQYGEFERLTQYPHLVNMRWDNINPIWILIEPLRKEQISTTIHYLLVPAAMKLFVDEVRDFLARFMPKIDAAELFRRLLQDGDVNNPSFLQDDLERHVAQDLYEALRTAVHIGHGQSSSG
jgi:hypothetical protein